MGIVVSVLLTGCHNRGPAGAAESSACSEHANVRPAEPDTAIQNPVATFDSAWSIVARTHWDTTYVAAHWSAVRDSLRPRAARTKTSAELRVVLRAMMSTFGQSHFSIAVPTALDVDAAALQSAPRVHNAGIDATYRIVDGALVLTAVDTGGAAARAGLHAGFTVESVNGCRIAPNLSIASKEIGAPTLGLDSRAAKLGGWRFANRVLTGAEGENLQISARDDHGQLRSYNVILKTEPGIVTRFGNLPPVTTRLTYQKRAVNGKAVGIIQFNSWQPALSEAMSTAIDSLRDADAIVLDLRGNMGGLSLMTLGTAGHFVDSALTLGTMIERGSEQKYLINPQRLDRHNRRVRPFSGPLALVVDELSSSTTEIFAAGLQGIGRARVFGVQTAGQSLPAVAERLPDGDVLYHAVANFLSPTGMAIEGRGVTPDVVVPITRKALLQGADPALDAAVAWAANRKTGRPQ